MIVKAADNKGDNMTDPNRTTIFGVRTTNLIENTSQIKWERIGHVLPFIPEEHHLE